MPSEPGVQEHEWVLWVELWLRAVREPAFQPVAARLYARYRAWIEDVLRAGVEAGEFTAFPGAVADHAMALLDGVGIRALLRDPTMGLGAPGGLSPRCSRVSSASQPRTSRDLVVN